MTLQFKGYTITEAMDGMEAYELLKENEYDLVISDLAMPRMTGMELLNKIRKDMNNDTMPVIICTAEKDAPEEDFMKRGASKVMMKPVPPNDLISVVQNLIG